MRLAVFVQYYASYSLCAKLKQINQARYRKSEILLKEESSSYIGNMLNIFKSACASLLKEDLALEL